MSESICGPVTVQRLLNAAWCLMRLLTYSAAHLEDLAERIKVDVTQSMLSCTVGDDGAIQ